VRLVVEEGYNRGTEYALGTDALVLGRGEECSIQLLDDGVSRKHVELRREGGGISVRDLGSRNGTRVNGIPVEQATALPGDRIALGGVRLLVVAPVVTGPVSGTSAVRPTSAMETPPRLDETVIEPLPPTPPAEELLGESPPVRALLATLARIAPAPATVLIQGETGTGKELLARAIHRLSPRRRAPFVVVNSAALPRDLVESEIFGHEKGAFTGALARKRGLAETAHTGTIFLDELGELPLAAQAKLLRFLEQKEVQRLGSTDTFKVDVRLVAATHRDLEEMVREGTFRADLLFRLRVVELRVPPLRERPGDVRLLAEAFLRRSSSRVHLTEEALAALEAYPWPGNVRELANTVEAASILSTEPEIGLAALPERILAASGRKKPPVTLAEVERAAIVAALERHGGNRTRAAEELGIDRKTLAAKLKPGDGA
jgi:DNA-binding NtrC family response regulator